MTQPEPDTHFDSYADKYDQALQQGIAISGESKDYFAAGRLKWLSSELAGRDFHPTRICDFGCGTGSATPHLLAEFPAAQVLGTDISTKSLEIAQSTHGSGQASFLPLSDIAAAPECDLVFCNGVFHHIPPADRPAAMTTIHSLLRSGGYFAIFENNPYNPGTRLIMSRCPFDDDAILLTPRESAQLQRDASLEVILTRYLFIFPRFLRVFRPLETILSPLPLGAQYVVLGKKPSP